MSDQTVDMVVAAQGEPCPHVVVCPGCGAMTTGYAEINKQLAAAEARIREQAIELDELRNEVMALQADGTGYSHGYERASEFLSVRVNERIRERDDARARIADLERERDDAQEYAKAMAGGGDDLAEQLAAQSALLAEMTAALTGLMRRRLPNGDPCWCSDAEIAAHYPAHGYWCARARALLSRQQPGGE